MKAIHFLLGLVLYLSIAAGGLALMVGLYFGVSWFPGGLGKTYWTNPPPLPACSISSLTK